jgi:hypothetical protein
MPRASVPARSQERLRAERAVVHGAGHAAHVAPGFNDVLVDFLDRAAQSERK